MRFFLVLVIGIRVGLCSLPETNMKTVWNVIYYHYRNKKFVREVQNVFRLSLQILLRILIRDNISDNSRSVRVFLLFILKTKIS